MLQAFWLLALASGLDYVLGFDNSRNDNLAVYWGQNSYGATHPTDTANFQQTLSYYCADDTIDAIPIAFLDIFFDAGGLPGLDLANICSSTDDPVFAGSDLANCGFLATDIETCQSKGKIVTLSLGGGGGGGTFTSASQASAFADQIWNLFLGGSSDTRPFGTAVLDGVDLDIEGGSTVYFDSFVNQIRSHAAGASKPYYVTAAPQCPFPDAYLGTVLNEVGFDAVYVQFYNQPNSCSLSYYPNNYDFSSWDNWVQSTAINKNVKIYIGAPGAPSAAPSGGYVDPATLGTIIDQTRSTYASFGGVMLWDASQAYVNDRYDVAAKSYLTNGGGTAPTTPTTTATTTSKTSSSTQSSSSTSTSSTTSPPASSGSCAGVGAWSSGIAYTAGQQVVYNGHLWSANWWTEADAPGGAAGDWTDDGACTTSDALATAAAKVDVASDAAVTKAASAAVASGSAIASAVESAPPAAKTTGARSTTLSNTTVVEGSKNITATSRRSRFFR